MYGYVRLLLTKPSPCMDHTPHFLGSTPFSFVPVTNINMWYHFGLTTVTAVPLSSLTQCSHGWLDRGPSSSHIQRCFSSPVTGLRRDYPSKLELLNYANDSVKERLE